MYWVTKTGDKIPIEKLDTPHLKNILLFIERKSAQGIKVQYGGGAWDVDDIWYDEEFLTGEDAKKHMNYYELLAEYNKRLNNHQ